MTREEKTGVAIGGIGGLLVCLYDFRHIFLGGNPRTAITDAIWTVIPVKRLCDIGLEGVNDICEFLTTLLIFTFIGIAVGYTAVYVKGLIKK